MGFSFRFGREFPIEVLLFELLSELLAIKDGIDVLTFEVVKNRLDVFEEAVDDQISLFLKKGIEISPLVFWCKHTFCCYLF